MCVYLENLSITYRSPQCFRQYIWMDRDGCGYFFFFFSLMLEILHIDRSAQWSDQYREELIWSHRLEYPCEESSGWLDLTREYHIYEIKNLPRKCSIQWLFNRRCWWMCHAQEWELLERSSDSIREISTSIFFTDLSISIRREYRLDHITLELWKASSPCIYWP